MDTQKRWLALITLGLFLLALPVSLLADEPEPDKKDSKIIIVHDGDEEVVIEMEEIHEIMAEAMEGLDEAMSELQDMQVQVRLGQDNKLDLSYEDTTFELDLDQIMTQVASAVQVGFEEFNTSDWTHRHDRWSHASDDDLRAELDDLQEEIQDLRRELRKLKNTDDD
jgi:hypothetical protein